MATNIKGKRIRRVGNIEGAGVPRGCERRR